MWAIESMLFVPLYKDGIFERSYSNKPDKASTHTLWVACLLDIFPIEHMSLEKTEANISIQFFVGFDCLVHFRWKILLKMCPWMKSSHHPQSSVFLGAGFGLVGGIQ